MHVLTNVADGGLEKVVYLIVSNIKNTALSHSLAVLTKSENTFLLSRFKDLGIKINEFNFENKKKSAVLKNFAEIFKLAKAYKNSNIQVIHSHDFFPAFISRISAVVSTLFFFHKPKKIIITLHNIFFWLSPLHHKINKVLSFITSYIVCCSRSVYEYSAKNDKIKQTKYKVIYNGVETDKYKPDTTVITNYKKSFDFSEENFIIGNVGVLSVRKGQKYLINAFAKVYKKHPNCRLLIFGSEREHEKEIAEEIKMLIDANNLNEVVKIISPREDLNKIYNIFDLFVMPSISEGLSLSAIEALLMEKMCLFSDIKPFEEMIETGENKNGFIFKSKDAGDLEERINYIIENYDKLETVKKNARRIALEKYDVIRMAKEYENIYL